MLAERIATLISPAIEAMGFDLVRVQVSGSQRPTLQVMAEPASGRAMSVDDCVEISRAISAVLDVEDPIAGSYSLEVSSPGIDRPLTRAKDYERFLGHEAKVETSEPLDGRKRFKGPIKSVDASAVELTVDGADLRISFAAIHKAKLVLTDALIALHQVQDGNEGDNEQEDD
ncbi:MAG TPA: ribosome maturation factor RimP [Dongiaceae bacterium]|nr:ribosome maturation factor RimP [Dongiaceae bacterium]